MERHAPTRRLTPSGYTVTCKSSCGDRRSKSLVESECGSDLGKIVLSDVEIHDQNADLICVFQKSMIRMRIGSDLGTPLRSPPAIRLAGPPASPCRSALDDVASFTTPVDIVSMHNLFLQDV